MVNLDDNDNTIIEEDISSDEEIYEGQLEHEDALTLDYFFDEKTWDNFSKNLEDFDENDMSILQFDSLTVCEQFYLVYAKAKGFGVRKCGVTKSRADGRPISRKLVCNKEDVREEKWFQMKGRKRRAKQITRCGCQAFIHFKSNDNAQSWKVTAFNEEHNHGLWDPVHIIFDKSHKNFTYSDVAVMVNAGTSPSGIMRNMVEVAGSHRKVGFGIKDLHNLCDKIKRDDVKYGDAETVMEYIIGKQIDDLAYFVSYTKNEENRLDKLFWCDGISRGDYKAFGHVIAFDTTYKSNAYNKPFVVIVGVNNHRKTISFACALIVDEREESFIWVLQQLIKAGGDMKPQTVITDGDKAMANAIKVVLPNARHRLCLWHLMRNVRTNGGKKFASGFMKCVDKCRTKDEFEEAWKELVTSHGFEQKKWAIELYRDKEKWSEAYLAGYFFAGMRSTQRVESMHHSVKTVLNKKILLSRFLELYDKVIDKLRFEHSNLDYTTMNSLPVIDGVLSRIKNHACMVYTRDSYEVLCQEISFESMYVVRRVEKDLSHPQGPIIQYHLQHSEKEDMWYIVLRREIAKMMYCCCMKLVSVGFPCRHMFCVMKYENMREIPAGCVLQWWTIHAKEMLSGKDVKRSVNDEDNEKIVMARFASLTSLAMQLCHQASKTSKSTSEVKDTFAKLIMKTSAHEEKRTRQKAHMKRPFGIGDPEVVITKGKPKRTKNSTCGNSQRSQPIRSNLHNFETSQNETTETRDFDLNNTPMITP